MPRVSRFSAVLFGIALGLSPRGPAARAQDACATAAAHWALVESADRVEFYEEHLRLFPNCAFSALALRKISQMRAAPPPAPASASPPVVRAGGSTPSAASLRRACGAGERISARGTCIAAAKAAPATKAAGPRSDPDRQARVPAAREPARGRPGMYAAPQPGMSCTVFGIPQSGLQYHCE